MFIIEIKHIASTCMMKSWHLLYKKTKAQVPVASGIEGLECVVDLLHL